ncbi:hypothetical protein FH972_022670 [Carpinus fangiana]|uniref:PX domain-containing protein n=1 Tax=Carpinus fangiana TaxID=176857 RepID=A0A5N6KTK6_9ROSI|nr:hypothetical protein FH972_022670 [Carpinus fangiana]
MAPALILTIPSVTTSTTPKPYTVYKLSLKQPLRNYNLEKRYSDFVDLHSTLQTQTGADPPAPLPSKSWFKSTLNNPTLTEARRRGLEEYLTAINESVNPVWRNTSAWKAFLKLPSTGSGAASLAGSGSPSLTSQTTSAATGNTQRITDPADEGAQAQANEAERDDLFSGAKAAASGGRRVLGGPLKETDRTRELDNEGVLQLQKQIMQEQDLDVGDLTKVVQRMKEMGVQINNELELQNEMLGLLDQDVDRVEGKIGVAKKRLGKIK